MQITLPPLADVAQAIARWSANDARLGQLMERYGDVAPAVRHYGLVLWETGDIQAASQVLTAAVALEPGDARAWHDLSSVLNGLGQSGEAAACAENSLAFDPTSTSTWMQLGSIRGALGDRSASIAAYEKAIALDEGLVDAWIGLGIAFLQNRRYEGAVASLRRAVALGKADDAGVQACLGEALHALGDFAGAARAFTLAAGQMPDHRGMLAKRARAQFLVDAIEGDADTAVATLERQRIDATEVAKIVHDGFHLLSAYDQAAAAIRLGEFRLAAAPDDATQRYLLATLKGEPIERAPDSYIVSFFDKFAEDFDHQLVGVLDYRVPDGLAALVRQSGRPIERVLDLGCGTGLAGPALAAPGRILTGVDLSPGMLDKARRLGCYATLIEDEVVAFLARDADIYDLIVGADLLIYFGGLTALFEGIARRLTAGGLCALSVETIEAGDILHLPSGRFAHGLDYVEREGAKVGLGILRIEPTIIRLDANKPAEGALLLLEKA